MNKTIIAINGIIGSGKNRLTREIYRSIKDKKVAVISFAYPMKRCVEIITGIEMETLNSDNTYDFSRKQKSMQIDSGMKLGKFLVEFSQKCRELDDEIWINILKREVEKSKAEVFIIPDMRMLSEVNALKQWNGYNLYTVRIDSTIKHDSPLPDDGRNPIADTEIELSDYLFDYKCVVSSEFDIDKYGREIAERIVGNKQLHA